MHVRCERPKLISGGFCTRLFAGLRFADGQSEARFCAKARRKGFNAE